MSRPSQVLRIGTVVEVDGTVIINFEENLRSFAVIRGSTITQPLNNLVFGYRSPYLMSHSIFRAELSVTTA
jgi:hypothetical protein